MAIEIAPERPVLETAVAASAPVAPATPKRITKRQISKALQENEALSRALALATYRLYEGVQSNYSGTCHEQVAEFVYANAAGIRAYNELLNQLGV